MTRLLLSLVPLAILAAPPRVIIGDPVLVVEAPAGERRWGRYQFPRIWPGAGNEVVAFVHIEPDAVESYGKPPAAFLSRDGGASWQPDPTAAGRPFGLRLPGGDRLLPATTPALPVATAALPPPAGRLRSYGDEYTFYPLADLPIEMRLIFFDRFPAAGPSWQREHTPLAEPDGLRGVVRGRLPRIWWGDIRIARDRSLLAVVYPSYRLAPGRVYCEPACYRSTDNGRSWTLQGRIPYRFDPEADPHAAERGGFTEPAFEILKDGSLYAVMRTTDGLGLGPMYASRSKDMGRTWTRPHPVTPTGVMPRLLLLANGALVMTSGRPGVDLRFSFDGRGARWTEPRQLVPADAAKPQADSCGYTDLLPIDRNTFLLIYSWFNRPGAGGLPHKSVLVRRISVAR